MEAMYMLLVLVLNMIVKTIGLDCVKKDRCSCIFDDNSGMIDLSSIGNTDNSPLFFDQISTIDIYWYSYNPCYPFNEGTCQGVAACQYDYLNMAYYDVGNADSATFSYNGLTTDITYTSVDGTRTTIVNLLCDPAQAEPVLQVTGEQTTNTYYMTLTAAAACKVPVSSSKGSGGISAGSVLLIIFFATFAVYLIVGIGFNKYSKGLSGRQLVPNSVFWQSLPGLIKDGYGFTLSCFCRRRGYDVK